ncbi:MAG: outer membrane beta-barrel protein [Nitrospira sp.]|nr:outer membrane beta-barrel protein [Nitrospira sp.]
MATVREVISATSVAVTMLLIIFWDMVTSSPAKAELRLIPSISLSERYDTNIFYAPTELIPKGVKRDDFATILGTQLQLFESRRDGYTKITAGLTGTGYANNPALNYVATQVDGVAKLDDLIGQLVDGARLTLADNFRYTPQPPGFLAGDKAPSVTDPFIRGIQVYRANSITNTFSAAAAYPVARGLDLRGDYAFSFIRFGTPQIGTGIGFFDTNVHSWSVGPGFRISDHQNFNISYLSSKTDFVGTGSRFEFETRGLAAEYQIRAPTWTAKANIGANVLDPGDRIFPIGSLSLTGKFPQIPTVQVMLTRTVAPLFFGTFGAMISNVVSVSSQYDFSRVLSMTGSANYAINESAPIKTTTFKSVGTSAALTYKLTRTWATTLSYEYSKLDGDLQGQPYVVDRHATMFSLTARWP